MKQSKERQRLKQKWHGNMTSWLFEGLVGNILGFQECQRCALLANQKCVPKSCKTTAKDSQIIPLDMNIKWISN
jgi:hypothetical protein